VSEPVAAEVVVDQLPPFPTLHSVLQRFGRKFAFDALVPVVLFLVVNGVAGLAWAVAASSAWAVSLIVARRRAGTAAGPMVWFSLGYALIRGAAGIVTGSGAVYFGPGAAGNLLGGLAFVGSVLVGRPIVGSIATIFYRFPDEVRRGRAHRRVFSHLTLAWAALLIFTGVLQIALLVATTANAYLIVRSLVTWPLILGLFVISLRYPRRVLAREVATAGSNDRTAELDRNEE
jgi:hypothetical protein